MTENDGGNRKILHRVVFYDLLSTPSIDHQRDTYGRIHEAHLSIPLIPGLETVWAPNGYGKTFAMQMLERMWKPVRWSSEVRAMAMWWFDDFLSECQGMIKNVSETLSSGQIRDYNFLQVKVANDLEWHPRVAQRMRPFSIMMARIVELDNDGRINSIDDLWIKPKWNDFLGIDIEAGINVIDHTNRMRKKGSLEHIRNHCSNDGELCELLISWDGLSKRENQLIKSLADSLESDDDYLTPIIPKTYDHEGKEWSGSVYDKKTGEWIKGKSTAERLPPEQNQYLEGGKKLENDRNWEGFGMSGPGLVDVDLLDVLRTTKVDYLEIPKTSMEFFPDEATAEKNVIDLLKLMKQLNGMDPADGRNGLNEIENRINDVLEMKGVRDPWSRKVVLQKRNFNGPRTIQFGTLHQMDTIPGSFSVPYSNFELITFRKFEDDYQQESNLAIEELLTRMYAAENQLNDAMNKESLIMRLKNLESTIDHLEGVEREGIRMEAIKKIRPDDPELSPPNISISDIREDREKIGREIDNVRKEIVMLESQIDNLGDKENQEPTAILKAIMRELEQVRKRKESSLLKGFILRQFEEIEGDISGNEWLIQNYQNLRNSLENNNLVKIVLSEGKNRKQHKEFDLTEFMERMKDIVQSMLIGTEPTFEVLNLFKNEPLARDVLSFGQKSTILTELLLGTFENMSKIGDNVIPIRMLTDEEFDRMKVGASEPPALPVPLWQGGRVKNRYCLIVDEPEVGRSEYSVNKLIRRLEKSKDLMDDLGNNTVLVLSHRNKLLTQVSGQYHLLQPVDLEFQSEEE